LWSPAGTDQHPPQPVPRRPALAVPEYIPPLSALKVTRAARVKAEPYFTDGLRSAFGCLAHNAVTASANVISDCLRDSARQPTARIAEHYALFDTLALMRAK
jgi:hypothetical protein